MKTIQTLAAELYKALNIAKRDDGSEFYKLDDDSPDWMTDAVRSAHDGMMPDDWKYQHIGLVAGKIADLVGVDSADDVRESAHEVCDGLVDVYNAELLKWVASSLTRAEYVDDAIGEFGFPTDDGLYKALQYGQFRELESIYYSLVESFESLAAETDGE
jgi:hypothetical protein